MKVTKSEKRGGRGGSVKAVLKICEGPLDAVEKRGVEVDAGAEVAQQVGDRETAGLVKEPAHGHGARRVGECRLTIAQPAESGWKRPQRHRGHAGACPRRERGLRPVQISRLE